MLLHMPLTISEGFNVGSSTTSTISAPRGSSCSSLLGAGNGGGGGGLASTGSEATRFKILDELLVKVFAFEGEVGLGGSECLPLDFDLSTSSSELRVDGDEDKPLSCESLPLAEALFLSIFSYFCGLGKNSLGFFTSFLAEALGVSLTITLQPELDELADAERLWEPESRDLDRMLFARSLFFDSSLTR